MLNVKSYSVFLIITLFVIFPLACEELEGLTATRIEDILNDARAFEGRQLTVVGTVTEETISTLSLGGLGAFRLNDGTATITIVTPRIVPQPGQRVTVKGKVTQIASINRSQLLVLVESPQEKQPELTFW